MITPSTAAQVNLILSQSREQNLYVSLNRTASMARLDGTTDPVLMVDEHGRWRCDNEQVHLLKLLQSNLPDAERAAFPSCMIGYLSASSAPIVAHTLVEIRRLDAVPEIWARRKDFQLRIEDRSFTSPHPLIPFWKALRMKLALESGLFTDDNLALLQSAAQATTHALHALAVPSGVGPNISAIYSADGRGLQAEFIAFDGTVERVRYLRLKKQLLSHINPELNADRLEVASRIERLGLPKELVSALNDVELKIQNAASPAQCKEAIDLSRSFYETAVVQAAKHVARRSNYLGFGPGPFNPYKQYLRSQGLFSETEEELFQKFYNYLSVAGPHSLASTPEQARVAKNVAIELILMLLGRVIQADQDAATARK